LSAERKASLCAALLGCTRDSAAGKDGGLGLLTAIKANIVREVGDKFV
jgi:hypothetical protein